MIVKLQTIQFFLLILMDLVPVTFLFLTYKLYYDFIMSYRTVYFIVHLKKNSFPSLFSNCHDFYETVKVWKTDTGDQEIVIK